MPTVRCISTGEEEEGQDQGEGDHTTSFTKKTKAVLATLQKEFKPASRKRRANGSGPHAPGSIKLNGLVEGRSRRDASLWFFEMLVLQSKDYVKLGQEEPYGDVEIAPRPKLLAV